jgi:glycine betaine/proline transport system substrate-binding protein
MKNKTLGTIGLCLIWSLQTSSVQAENINECGTVRLAEPGWTDLALTTATTKLLLDGLGYKASSNILGLSVILEGMKNGDIDAMLGYWKPAMNKTIKGYLKEGSIENISVNLTGAKYTYAVPKYVYDAGVTDINDLAKYSEKFNKRLYGIEPGSNTVITNAIKDGKYGLDGWKVVESSEQGMMAQVARSIKGQKWIAFQGWEPHPMNVKFDMAYLSGTDDTYGPNFGGATVNTVVRKGYLSECGNIGRLLSNMHFTLKMENTGMGYILEDKKSPEHAARIIIADNQEFLKEWLSGVKTIQGQNGLDAVLEYLKL